MKRHPALVDLSRNHYKALKWARDAGLAARTGDPAQIEAVAGQVVEAFASEFLPHFQTEEAGILGLLARAGERDLVERALSDHADLRAIATALEAPDAQTLQRFSERMAAHVRFEERQLFEAAQRYLESSAN